MSSTSSKACKSKTTMMLNFWIINSSPCLCDPKTCPGVHTPALENWCVCTSFPSGMIYVLLVEPRGIPRTVAGTHPQALAMFGKKAAKQVKWLWEWLMCEKIHLFVIHRVCLLFSVPVMNGPMMSFCWGPCDLLESWPHWVIMSPSLPCVFFTLS